LSQAMTGMFELVDFFVELASRLLEAQLKQLSLGFDNCIQ
jgi:hypothetical protein